MKSLMRSMMILPLAAVLSCGAVADKGAAVDEAVQAAEKWLQLIDEGEYEQSWHEAASLFKAAVAAEQWSDQVQSARAMFGEFGSRRVQGAEYMTSMPGAPDGEYVVIQFEASFTNKEGAIETVTPMKGEDGVWRVAGYYIK